MLTTASLSPRTQIRPFSDVLGEHHLSSLINAYNGLYFAAAHLSGQATGLLIGIFIQKLLMLSLQLQSI